MRKPYGLLLVIALIFSMVPVYESHANLMDTFDIVINWISYGMQSNNDTLADEIVKMIQQNPAQKDELKQHISKTAPIVKKFRRETNDRVMHALMLQDKIPLTGGLVSAGYTEWKLYSYKSDLEKATKTEIAKKYEELHGNVIDADDEVLMTLMEQQLEIVSKERNLNNDILGGTNLMSLNYMKENADNAMNKVLSQLR